VGKAVEHFVAQSYLRRFTFDGDHLYAFEKSTSRVFPANVRNIAAEHNFFGDEIDARFSGIDSEQPFWLDLLIENVEQGTPNPLTDEMKRVISGLASLQGHRTRESRRVLLDIAKKEPQEREAVLRDGEAAYHLGRFTWERFGYVREAINNCYWVIYKNSFAGYPFVTSDNPVILEGEHTLDDHSRLDMIWPVSPRVLIYAMSRATHKNFPKEFDIQEVVKVNSWQAQNCHRFVFSPIDSFDYVRKFLEDNPNLKDPIRDRSLE